MGKNINQHLIAHMVNKHLEPNNINNQKNISDDHNESICTYPTSKM